MTRTDASTAAQWVLFTQLNDCSRTCLVYQKSLVLRVLAHCICCLFLTFGWRGLNLWQTCLWDDFGKVPNANTSAGKDSLYTHTFIEPTAIHYSTVVTANLGLDLDVILFFAFITYFLTWYLETSICICIHYEHLQHNFLHLLSWMTYIGANSALKTYTPSSFNRKERKTSFRFVIYSHWPLY